MILQNYTLSYFIGAKICYKYENIKLMFFNNNLTYKILSLLPKYSTKHQLIY